MTAAATSAEWRKLNPYPEREVRAREALEIAARAGVSQADIDAAHAECGLPPVFAYQTATDDQLAKASARLRILAGFYG